MVTVTGPRQSGTTTLVRATFPHLPYVSLEPAPASTLRGALFETWVATEIRKARANRGVDSGLAHYRETRGAEVDLVVTETGHVTLIEVKSGATIASDWFTPLRDLLGRNWDHTGVSSAVLVYGGEQTQQRHGVRIQPWRALHELPWTVAG